MTDIEIAHRAKMKKVLELAKEIKVPLEIMELYGDYKAKIDFNKVTSQRKGKLILVTAINPTIYGEGKTTVSIGLGDALRKLNKNSLIVLREPSLGPVFGQKGGSAGGGYSQVVPMEDINLHFTGDFHAITSANNLICAAIDNELYYGNKLNLDPDTINFSRCLDINDRALRQIVIGKSSDKETVRCENFNITAASEMMTILCLAKDSEDLRRRVDDIFIGYTYDGKSIYVRDLNISGSVVTLLKDAIKPNLVQTLENNPVIIHGGPFANIAHGCNSIIATDLALKLSDYVVTEAGFGSDLGAEKFLDIKCRIGNFKPSAIVLVCTIKALKYNGKVSKDDILKENASATKKGLDNLLVHIENLRKYGVPFVVALNKYDTDTEAEIKIVSDFCFENKVPFEISDTYSKGGFGAENLANRVLNLCEEENNFKFLYSLEDNVYSKIETIAKEIYHASSVSYCDKAKGKLEKIIEMGKGNLPVCISKTQYSISDDPKKLGYPKDYTINVTDVKLYSGAGFITVLLGNIVTMPGLPEKPNYERIDVVDEKIVGIF